MAAYEWTWGITRYPHGPEPELGNFYLEDAEPRCSTCEDYGEVVGKDGGIETCPECNGVVKAEVSKRKPKT